MVKVVFFPFKKAKPSLKKVLKWHSTSNFQIVKPIMRSSFGNLIEQERRKVYCVGGQGGEVTKHADDVISWKQILSAKTR